jgi:hypothetical protein
MDVGAALVTNGQASESVEPGDGAFDDPATDAKATAVRGATTRQHGHDAACPQAVAVRLRIIPAVTLECAGSAARTPAAAPHRRQRIDHRIEMGDVVDVGRGYLCDERDPARIRDEVVFGTRLAAIGWVRSSFFPPRTARTEPLSITVHRWSRRPRRRRSASSVS